MERTTEKKPFYGWKLLVVFWAIIILNFTFPTFGASVVNTYMARAMHLNREKLGLAFSVFSLMAGLPGPLVAQSINRLGIRFTLAAGALLTSCGALLMAVYVKTTFQVLVVLGLIVGAGAAMAGTLAPQVGAARWFHRKRARAMSLMLTASGLGGCIAVPTLQAVIARFDGNWRAAWCRCAVCRGWCAPDMSTRRVDLNSMLEGANFVIGALLMFPARTSGFALSGTVVIGAAIASAALIVGALGALLHSRKKPVVTGSEALIGAEGETVFWEGEEGRVRVKGEIWRARADAPLKAGTAVKVIRRDGLVLLVQSM